MSEKRFPTTKSRKLVRVDDLIQKYEGVLDEVDAVLHESQISGPLPKVDVPDGLEAYILWGENNDPLPPEDLTEVNDLLIGKLFSYFQNWTNYVTAELTRAEVEAMILKKLLGKLYAALDLHHREDLGTPAGQIKARVLVDEEYDEVDHALTKLDAFVKIAKGRQEGLKRTLNAISREQTRRADELERTLHDEKGGRIARGVGDTPRANARPFGRR